MRDTNTTPLDIWVRRSLIRRYSPVLEEELPESWLALLQQAPAR